jgi:hypothetical protein
MLTTRSSAAYGLRNRRLTNAAKLKPKASASSMRTVHSYASMQLMPSHCGRDPPEHGAHRYLAELFRERGRGDAAAPPVAPDPVGELGIPSSTKLEMLPTISSSTRIRQRQLDEGAAAQRIHADRRGDVLRHARTAEITEHIYRLDEPASAG